MDDRGFDDIIKSRLSNYSDPEFNPASLASLHQQMASHSVPSWFTSYRTEIITLSGFAFCTILILLTQWYWSQRQSDAFANELAGLKSDHGKIQNLQAELDYWKSVKHDTIRVIEMTREATGQYTLLLHRINALENEIERLKNQQRVESIYRENEISHNLDFTGNGNSGSDPDPEDDTLSRRLVPRVHNAFSVRTVPENLLKQPKFVPVSPSVKAMRDIEKHYRNGIGIRVGPVIEASRGIYSYGEGQYSIGYGGLADLILSPSLSVETGVKYFKKYYDISDSRGLGSTDLPGVDESAGDLHKAEIDYWLLEVPVNLKYRYPISLKQHWLVGVGFSPMVYTKQIFEYDYKFNGGTNGNFLIHSTYQDDNVTVYPGALNFSIGLSSQLKNKKILEASLFYQHGLNDMGVEKTRTRFFGLRGVYWFTLK